MTDKVPPVSLLAVTVFAHDRPGIIAEVTAALRGIGGNLEDSTMTILRGRLAMMLIVSSDASVADVVHVLKPLEASGMSIGVQEVPPEADAEPTGRPYVLSVHGGDRPGIVSSVTGLVAEAGGNITDLTTRLTSADSGGLYVLVAEVDLPESADVALLETRLHEAGKVLGVEVALRPGDTDVF